MENKFLQFKRSNVIYQDREVALTQLNNHVQSNLDKILDGEPIVGFYYGNGEIKALLGICINKSTTGSKGVYWFDMEAAQGTNLVPGDASIKIENDEISVNIKSDADNALKIDENGAYVSISEIIGHVPSVDLSGLTLTQEVVFGEELSDDTTDASGFYTDDSNLSGVTSLVEADKKLSEAIDENSLAIAAAFNNLNDRVEELSGTVETLEDGMGGIDDAIDAVNDRVDGLSGNVNTLSTELDDAKDDIIAISGVVDDNSLAIAAAFNDLNDRINEISGEIPTERIAELEQEVSDLGQDVSDLQSGLTEVADDLSGLTQVVDDNSLTIAAAFNDVNDRLNDLSARTEGIDGVANRVSAVEEDVSGLTSSVDDLENNIESIGDDIEDINSGMSALTQAIMDNELVIAASLNDLNSRIVELSGSSVTEITSSSLDVTTESGTTTVELPEELFDVEIDGGDY